MKKNLRTFSYRLGLLLLLTLLSGPQATRAQQILNNGKLRFGNGAEQSVNTTGNLQQPFYWNQTNNVFYKLTFSTYPLDNAYAAGGDGTAEWNTAGTIVNNPVLTGQVINNSGFIATSGNSGYGTIISTGTVSVAGQMIQVQNTYTLGQTSSYIQVKTRLMNVSANALSNVRYWIGTRDDWVGNTDAPRKQRGNLVNNAFVQNTTMTARALALKVTTGNEGVLFYTAHPKATVIVHPNYGDFYSRIVLSNPASSTVDITSDGSYGMYVRLNDLPVNGSDEFTWYYAAGDVASFNDIISQVATVSGAVQNITYTTAQLNATSSVSATGYWTVVPQGSTAPTAAQIEAGVNYGSVNVAANGSGAMSANVQQSFPMTGLNPGTAYQVYFVSKDASNAYSTISSVAFTTLAYTTPSVTTTNVSAIAQTSAVSGGNVTAEGGQAVTARGICWNTTGAPTLANSSASSGAGTGSFAAGLANLNPGTTYFVRAYATNSVGTSYGNVVSFTTCPANPVITASGPLSFCQGGSVILTATPGGSYLWSNNATSQSITVSQSGTYAVTVNSGSGCSAQSASVAVNVYSLPSGTPLANHPLCGSSNDGSIIVYATGNAPFTYSKNGGAAYQPGNMFAPLAAGIYGIRVKDVNGCQSAVQNVTISAPPVLAFSTSKTDETCYGGNAGSITVNATGGTGNRQYSIDNGISYQSGNVFSNLGAGTYSVVVRDANNCVAPVQSVVITQPDPVTITPSVTDVACNGGADGSVSIAAAGGSGNTFAFSLNSGAPQASGLFNGLTAGSYAIQAADGNGCLSAVQTVSIAQPSTLTANATASNVVCAGDHTATATASAAGGTAPYSFSWSPVSATLPTAINLGTGTYTVTVTDAHNCTATASAVVDQVDTVLPTVLTQTVTVALNAGGTASVTASQVNNGSADNCGIAGYALSKTSFNCSEVGSNPVTLTVTDVNGNVATGTATVIVIDNILPTITAPSPVAVSADQTACGATNVNLGTPMTADNCSVASVTNNAPAFFALGNTNVTWTVTDANGNQSTATQTVTVTDVSKPVITAPANVVRNGYCTPITVAIGGPVVTDNCPVTVTAKVNNVVIDPATYLFPVGVTSVTWTATDGSGNFETAAQTVTVNPATVTTSAAVTPLYPFPGQEIQTIYLGYAPSAQSETINITPSGGTAPYSYSWTRSNCNSTVVSSSFSNPATSSTYTFSPTSALICKSDSDNVYTFTVVATDSRGCVSAPVTKKLNVVDPFVGNKIRICHIPPGEPSNPQILHVSVNALTAHFGHGDALGNCAQFQGRRAKPAEGEAVKVYPNPNNGSFQVEILEIAEYADIVVMDVNGRVVARQRLLAGGSNIASINLSKASAGVYLVQVSNGAENFRTRIVVQ